MFDIGFPELLIVSVVALLVLGPERLPEAMRSVGLWFGRARRSFASVKAEFDRELGMDEVRRQLHNEAILDEMKQLESDVHNIGSSAQGAVKDAAHDVEQAAQDLDDYSPEPHPDAVETTTPRDPTDQDQKTKDQE